MGHIICLAIIITSILNLGNGSLMSGEDESWDDFLKQRFTYLFGTTIAVVICLISFVIACTCWGNRKRLKLQSISSQIELQNQSGNCSLFPTTLSSHSSISDSKVYFEPLPDITPRAQVKKSSVCLAQRENWFAEPYQNFPRSQLQYIRQIGSGWFGHILEGRAIGIDTDHTSTAIPRHTLEVNCNTVIVKCLREDATIDEQSYYLQELLPYKKLRHTNLVRVLSFCLETAPFLILMEYCTKGDLKCVLKKEIFSDAFLIQMAAGVATGLSYMHQHEFIHTDLAARNCLVTEDYLVKIGDYGNSIEAYKNEYYLAERIALPLRWCSPESLHCTEISIETVELTKEANVWSFGVLLWEIVSRARLPYEDLGNDEIIQKVILEKIVKLQSPAEFVHCDKINCILENCFLPCNSRKNIENLNSALNELTSLSGTNSIGEDEFDKRWNKLNIALNNPSKDGTSVKISPDMKTFYKEPWKSLHFENNNAIPVTEVSQWQITPIMSTLPTDVQYNCFVSRETDIQSPDKNLSKFATTDVNISDECHDTPEVDIFTLTQSEEDFLTKRLEQGEFSELVRMKSQSVQDLMRLTVIDYSSDSSERASQLGSLVGDPSSLVSEKNFCSESNLKEAVRDDGFMVELERLQIEHRFSIISEVSREYGSLETDRIDDMNTNMYDSIDENISDSNKNIWSYVLPAVEANTNLNNVVTLDTSNSFPTNYNNENITTNNNKPCMVSSCSSLFNENNNIEQLYSAINDKKNNCLKSNEDNEGIDGGMFWTKQIEAWKEAAQETRQLLNEASQSSVNEEEAESFDYISTTDSPRKDSEDDSETYISYDTPKEDEDNYPEVDFNTDYGGVNPEDLVALRSELTLKLNFSTDAPGDLELQENIYINYRSGPVSLSPIKEESLPGEFEDNSDSFDDTVHQNASNQTSVDDFEILNAVEIIDNSSKISRLKTDISPPKLVNDDSTAADDLDHISKDFAKKSHNIDLDNHPSKYFCSNSSEPHEPKSNYDNMLNRDNSSGSYYQTYFNVGVSNVMQCGASLDDGSIYDSTDHTSLPYDVNFPDKYVELNDVTNNECSFNLDSNIDNLSQMKYLTTELESCNEDGIVDTSQVILKHEDVVELCSNGIKEMNAIEEFADREEPICFIDNDECESPDAESDMDSSSTSGEFVWMGHENPANSSYCGRVQGDKPPSDSSEVESDSGEEEFTPSMWNSQLTPKQSQLKSPEINSSVKKNVHWKQQKHHRVYEYPPEPATWHAEEHQQRRTWGGHNLDYLTLADWEFAEEFSIEDPEQFSCTNHTNTVPSIFSIAPLSYQNDDGMVVDDCDFLIRTGAPFSFKKSTFSANEYFHAEPTSDLSNTGSDNALDGTNAIEQSNAASNLLQSVGEMRHSKDNLRLNLPHILGSEFPIDILDNQKLAEVHNNDDCSDDPQ